MTPSQFSRIFYFDYLTEDMLRGTIYYNKRNYYKDLKHFLSERPTYRVGKILRKEFAVLGESKEFNKFQKWAEQPFSDEDKLYGSVTYFQKQYPTFTNYRFMLRAKNAGDLYIRTQMKSQSKDLTTINENEIRDSLR